MKNYVFISFLLVFVFCMLGFSAPALAQYNVMPQDDIDVTMSPQNPGPNTTVNVSIVSYSTDINAATVTWRVNGGTKQSGLGVKNFSFTTGNVNTTTTLGIVVNTAEGQTVTKTFNIKPSSVDLLWQTDSYTPPFYKGKPLFSYQNYVTFIAMPHIIGSNGVEISSKNLIYKWTLNGTVDAANGGAGKNTYSLFGSVIARPLDMQVEVTSPNDAGIADAETVVTPVDPQIVFYVKNPVYGIEFQNALLNNADLIGSEEVTIVGEPFFFGSLYQTSPELSYAWSINGSPISDDNRQIEQVFRQAAGTSGTSNIGLRVEDSSKILQTADNSFNLNFGQSATQTQASF